MNEISQTVVNELLELSLLIIALRAVANEPYSRLVGIHIVLEQDDAKNSTSVVTST